MSEMPVVLLSVRNQENRNEVVTCSPIAIITNGYHIFTLFLYGSFLVIDVECMPSN